jgi:hypothetical protein
VDTVAAERVAAAEAKAAAKAAATQLNIVLRVMIDELDPDMLKCIVDHVDPDALFPLAATCRALRAAVADHCPAAPNGKRTHTSMEFAYGHTVALASWARANGCQWDRDTCTYAARNGQLHVLQWARAHECPWDSDTCAESAANGHLHILQWARAHECPWNADTCIEAASNGHLHVLQWARANNCPE